MADVLQKRSSKLENDAGFDALCKKLGIAVSFCMGLYPDHLFEKMCRDVLDAEAGDTHQEYIKDFLQKQVSMEEAKGTFEEALSKKPSGKPEDGSTKHAQEASGISTQKVSDPRPEANPSDQPRETTQPKNCNGADQKCFLKNWLPISQALSRRYREAQRPGTLLLLLPEAFSERNLAVRGTGGVIVYRHKQQKCQQRRRRKNKANKAKCLLREAVTLPERKTTDEVIGPSTPKTKSLQESSLRFLKHQTISSLSNGPSPPLHKFSKESFQTLDTLERKPIPAHCKNQTDEASGKPSDEQGATTNILKRKQKMGSEGNNQCLKKHHQNDRNSNIMMSSDCSPFEKNIIYEPRTAQGETPNHTVSITSPNGQPMDYREMLIQSQTLLFKTTGVRAGKADDEEYVHHERRCRFPPQHKNKNQKASPNNDGAIDLDWEPAHAFGDIRNPNFGQNLFLFGK